MKKKLVLLLVTAMAATTVMAGCGSKESDSILILHRKYAIEMIGNW